MDLKKRPSLSKIIQTSWKMQTIKSAANGESGVFATMPNFSAVTLFLRFSVGIQLPIIKAAISY